ncbi:MAG: D-alanine--D-alanine ligase family protein [Saccharofermentanales bacterium]
MKTRSIRSICILFGGVSTEHLISGRSAYNIITTLQKRKLNITCVGITKSGQWIRYNGDDRAILDGTWEEKINPSEPLSLIQSGISGFSVRDFLVTIIGNVPDVIFPAVHGINCEDGTLQGLLELSGIPYVGCGVLASAVCMDKIHAKKIFAAARIPQCKYIGIQRTDIKKDISACISRIEMKIGYPCFLKPNNGGSSVGTKSAKNREELQSALREVAVFDRNVLVEEFIPCREIEAAVMGNEKPKVATLGEVVTAQNVEYYDYQTKYFDPDGATVCIPAALDPKVEGSIRKYAKKAYLAAGCAGLSRIDFFIDQRNGRIYINEINTLPGFTAISLFPKAWEASGLPIERLLMKLCELAVSEQKSKTRLEIIG